MKPLVALAFSLTIAFVAGCSDLANSPLKVAPGNKVVTFHVAGAT